MTTIVRRPKKAAPVFGPDPPLENRQHIVDDQLTLRQLLPTIRQRELVFSLQAGHGQNEKIHVPNYDNNLLYRRKGSHLDNRRGSTNLARDRFRQRMIRDLRERGRSIEEIGVMTTGDLFQLWQLK
jgi:hypothetical protein